VLEVERKVTWRLTPIIMISVMFAFFDRIISSVAGFQLQVDLTRYAKATLPKKEWTPALLLPHIQGNEYGRLLQRTINKAKGQ
jgi:hypothetical protein